jgi:fused signal recognition particle receptor
MEELSKINRVIESRLGRPADERFLTLDANTGQNALSQAVKFNETVPLSGLVMTKFDSSAKGGSILAVTEKLQVPIKFIGVGEQAEDLQPFLAQEFVEALF